MFLIHRRLVQDYDRHLCFCVQNETEAMEWMSSPRESIGKAKIDQSQTLMCSIIKGLEEGEHSAKKTEESSEILEKNHKQKLGDTFQEESCNNMFPKLRCQIRQEEIGHSLQSHKGHCNLNKEISVKWELKPD